MIDNHVVDATGSDGYHLSEDLADQAIEMITGHRSAAPNRPFFLYLAFGAGHGPHQVPEPYIESLPRSLRRRLGHDTRACTDAS